jgi:hypothetical protein
MSGQLSSSSTVRFSLAHGDIPRWRMPCNRITVLAAKASRAHLVCDELAVGERERLETRTVGGELVRNLLGRYCDQMVVAGWQRGSPYCQRVLPRLTNMYGAQAGKANQMDGGPPSLGRLHSWFNPSVCLVPLRPKTACSIE